jgi:hypothetical protein
MIYNKIHRKQNKVSPKCIKDTQICHIAMWGGEKKLYMDVDEKKI